MYDIAKPSMNQFDCNRRSLFMVTVCALLCPVRADSVSPQAAPVSTATVLTFHTAVDFKNATGAIGLFTADSGNSSSAVTLSPSFIDNSGTTVVASFSSVSTTPGMMLVQLTGQDSQGFSVKSGHVPVSIYSQPSSITISPSTCPVQLCKVIVTVNTAYVTQKSRVRLTHPSTGAMTYWNPTTITSAGSMQIVLKAMVVTHYAVHVSLDGVHYSNSYFTLRATDPGTTKVCFVYPTQLGDFGWAYSHNLARLALEKEYNGAVVTDYRAGVPEAEFGSNLAHGLHNLGPKQNECYNTYRALADGGCNLIIGVSFGYFGTMQNLSKAPEYSNIRWLHVGNGPTGSPTLARGFGRMYQTRYLAGIIAGGQMALESNPTCIAYLAAFSWNTQVVRQINAFAKGCKFANPNCVVKTFFIGAWGDLWKEEQGAKYAWDTLGCKYITQHSNNLIVQRVYKEQGGHGIGFNIDVRANIGDTCFVSAMYDWLAVYKHYTARVLSSTWVDNEEIWSSYGENAVSLSAMSPLVASSVKILVNAEAERLKKGNVREPFCGNLTKSDGTVIVQSADTCLSDGDLLGMKWFITGVENLGNFKAPPKPLPPAPPSGDDTLVISVVIAGAIAGLLLVALISVFVVARWRKARQKHLQAEMKARRIAAMGSQGHADAVLPRGSVVLVDTDVESSTALWEIDAGVMAEALVLHDEVLRSAIKSFGGIELLTEGDAFLVCFPDPWNAVQWCMTVQENLMKVEWSSLLLKSGNESSSEVLGIFKGLRVRMGADVGEFEENVQHASQVTESKLLKRSREISDFAVGGQTLISNQLYLSVQDKVSKSQIDVAPVGNVSDKSGDPENTGSAISTVQLLPAPLAGRLPEFLVMYEGETNQLRPPCGEIHVVFTTCSDHKHVSEINRDVAATELQKLTDVVEIEAESKSGYICKGSSGKYMIVFSFVEEAVAFAIDVNRKLCTTEWADALYSVYPALAPKGSPVVYSQGLRMGMGIASGSPEMFTFNKSTGKMDYYGQVVNRAARVSATSVPGEISLIGATRQCLTTVGDYTLTSRGQFALKGVQEEQEIFTLLSHDLAGRMAQFDEARATMMAELSSPSVCSPVSPASEPAFIENGSA